ncbi:Casein kinase I isoform alpha [Tritrichomonas foetus]|uniref:non-specific serine/threonine protein kinase n=1 Tax=Tritrichomonas foetus TaxID=1144522 RepID=A0A1J4KC85_9EUKA|nr:Casein kinase I isoform alpha [Tritrichomonas foetus]|eukprot:OHT08835.1 Casein kinase I isoform alpha [Tritrichomonas foetus]
MVDRQPIPAGKVIGNYEIIFLVGRGGFGDVYKVKDKKTSQMFALKTEEQKAKVKSLNIEIECLQNLEGACFPKLRAHGTDKKFKVEYLVMNIMGASVGLIRRQHDNILPIQSAFPIAIEMLRIIEKFHSFGYVHRDIKPSNFLTQQNPNDHLVLIDFGLCKKHIDPDTNEPYPYKEDVKFTGTKKYSSPNAHRRVELGRVDDLFSWFYSFLEIANGNLPWNEVQDSDEMLKMKTETIPIKDLVKELPNEIIQIHDYISSLQYADKPDYKHINDLMNAAMAASNVDPDEFNWSAFYSAHANLGDLSKSLPLSRTTSRKSFNLSEKKQKKEESSGSYYSESHEGGCCNIQ